MKHALVVERIDWDASARMWQWSVTGAVAAGEQERLSGMSWTKLEAEREVVQARLRIESHAFTGRPSAARLRAPSRFVRRPSLRGPGLA